MALVVTDLPLELIVDILSFLPVVDLLQAVISCRVFYHAANITYSRHHRKQLGSLFVYIYIYKQFSSFLWCYHLLIY